MRFDRIAGLARNQAMQALIRQPTAAPERACRTRLRENWFVLRYSPEWPGAPEGAGAPEVGGVRVAEFLWQRAARCHPGRRLAMRPPLASIRRKGSIKRRGK